MRRIFPPVLTLFVGLALGRVLWSGEASPVAVENSRTGRPEATDDVRLSDLAARVRRLELREPAQDQTKQDQRKPRSSPPSADDDQAEEQRSILLREMLLARLQATLTEPDADPIWSNKYQRELSNGLRADPSVASLLRDVTCANGLCRAEFTRQGEPGELGLSLTALLEHTPTEHGDTMLDPGMSSNEPVLYFVAREKTHFPSTLVAGENPGHSRRSD